MPPPKPIATRVMDNIWIGDINAARSKDFFKKAKIRGVLNCTPTIPHYFQCDSKIEYMRIPVHDHLAKRDINAMYSFLPVICEFIHKIVVLQGQTILVHCRAARQRSAASVAAYLIRFYGLTPEDAKNYLLEKKPDVFHFGKSINFGEAINRFYHKQEDEKKEVPKKTPRLTEK